MLWTHDSQEESALTANMIHQTRGRAAGCESMVGYALLAVT
jgi:hypothetical protein